MYFPFFHTPRARRAARRRRVRLAPSTSEIVTI
jgi:hypothetical protein